MLVVLAIRGLAWHRYVAVMVEAAPAATSKALDSVHGPFQYGGNMFALALCAIMLVWPNLDGPTMGIGVIVLVSGWLYKFSLITQAAYNQGFHLVRTPEKGGGTGPGAKPGWDRAA